MARLQFVTAKCHMALLPRYGSTGAPAPTLQTFQRDILPALSDALGGYLKLRCFAEAGEVLYHRARIYHSLDMISARDADSEAFVNAESDGTRAAAMYMDSDLAEFFDAGTLEKHIAKLEEAERECAERYS